MSRLSRRSALRGSVGLLTRRAILGAAPAALALGGPLLVVRPARAAKQYGPVVTDSEIKIGNQMWARRAALRPLTSRCSTSAAA